MEITYRLAEKEDLEDLTKFLSIPEIDNAFVKPLSVRNTTISERVHSKYTSGYWLLAKYENLIAGCLALIPNKEEIEISTFAVSPNYKGQGIGSILLDKAIETTKDKYPDITNLILDSWDGNPAIARLAEKKGFSLRESYEDPEKRPTGIKTLVYELKLK